MGKKYTYEQLMELAKERFDEKKMNELDFKIKHCREKSKCPVNSPTPEGGWIEIGEGCWKKIRLEGGE